MPGSRRGFPELATVSAVRFAPLAVAVFLHGIPAAAATRSRFEPTDLELERAGVLDVDVQLGTFSGDPSRPLVADFELDLGVARNVENEIDGALYAEGPSGGTFRGAHRQADPLWTSMKLGLIDGRDPDRHRVWGIGVQIGPRFAITRDTRGIGYEALLLAERTVRRTTLALNSGLLVDPPTPLLTKHATGIELGVDVTTKLTDRFSLIAELGILRFITRDPHQVYVTLGVSHAVSSLLDVHAIVLYGFLREGDHLGALVGVSPKFVLF